jgi:hypothetical protein
MIEIEYSSALGVDEKKKNLSSLFYGLTLYDQDRHGRTRGERVKSY